MRRSNMLLALPLILAVACDDRVTSPEPATLPSPSLAAASSADAGPRYTMQMLDVETALEPGERIGVAGAVNNRGQVTGQLFRDTDIGPRVAGALIWDSEAGTVEVIEIEGLSGIPFINDAGQLAGTLRRPSPALAAEPFLWTPEGGVETLGFMGVTEDLGPNGEVVGIAYTESFPQGEAFRRDPGSGAATLGTLPGESSSRATGISDAVVAGFSGSHAVAWEGESPTALPAPDGIGSRALAMNDAGEIVGVHFIEPGVSTGILWTGPDAQPVLLPCDPPAFQECRADAINNRGVILGSYGSDEAEFPMIWWEGVPYDLPERIEGEAPLFLFALDINDRGQIGGRSLRLEEGGQWVHTMVILTPITAVRTVGIDVKPNSDPSSFNLDGNGTIPVAVLGEADLGPHDIDPSSLQLNGLVISYRGNGQPQCEAEDVDGDGYADLVCHFEDDLSRWTGPDDVATLTGSLLDDTAIQGSDAIRIAPRGDA